MKRFGCLFAVVGLAVSCGCAPPPANPAAVLEGTWGLVFEEPGDLEGFDVQAVFDAAGQLTSITATSPEGGSASLNVDESTSTEVDGDQVTITIPSAAGARVFEGTLSEDQNSIDGDLSQGLDLPSGDLDVTLPGSGLVLNREEE